MNVYLRWKKYSNGTESAYLEINENGNRRKKYIGVKIQKWDTDKKEKRNKAKAIRTKYHDLLLNNKWDLVSDDKLNTPFVEYFQEFLKTYNKAGFRKYKAAFEKFKGYIKDSGKNPGITFGEMTQTVCEGFKDYLLDSDLAGETPYDYFVRFKAVINIAERDKYFIENPIKEIKFPKPENDVKKQVLTEEEIKVLAKTPCGNTEVKRAFIFACFTGLGEKEIKNLKWKEVANNRLNVKRAKNGKKVASKLPATAIKILGKSGASEQNVFNLPSNTAIKKNLERWLKKAGIDKHITFYCGRHTFAVFNLKNGANLLTISKLLGHKSTAHTAKYLNYIDEEKDKAMDNLPDMDII